MHVAILSADGGREATASSLWTKGDSAELGEAFRALGSRVSRVDLDAPDPGAALEQLMAGPDRPSLFIGFDKAGACLSHEGRSFFAAHGVHYLSVPRSHAAGLGERLAAITDRHWAPPLPSGSQARGGGRSLGASGNRGGVRRGPAQKLGPDWLSLSARLLPGLGPPPVDSAERWAASRDTPVLIVGDFVSLRRPPPESSASSRLIERTLALLEGGSPRSGPGGNLFMTGASASSAEAALGAVLVDMNLVPTSEQLTQLEPLLHTVVALAASRRQLALVEAVAKTGLPVVVCGDGWGSLVARFPNLEWRKVPDWGALWKRLTRTRLVVNAGGARGDTGLTQVFLAQAAGAAVVSECCHPLCGVSRDGEDVLLYARSDLANLTERVRALLEAPSTLAGLAARGQARAVAHHAWSHRAAEVLRLWRRALLEHGSLFDNPGRAAANLTALFEDSERASPGGWLARQSRESADRVCSSRALSPGPVYRTRPGGS